MTKDQYLENPCAASALPWHKTQRPMPSGVVVVHDSQYRAGQYLGYTHEVYFRLFHSLELGPVPRLETRFSLRPATEADVTLLHAIIQDCYEGMAVSAKDILSWREKRQVFDPSLWLIAEDVNGQPAGSGIAELDTDMREGALEWIQVLPNYRGLGVGTAIVSSLLHAMRGKADFATVSGLEDATGGAERLYRSCGFTGSDRWHVLRRQ